jgi:hypothetical protein
MMTLTYVPDENWFGEDTVTITYVDAQGFDSTLDYTFTVNPMDHGPATVVSGDGAITDEDTPVLGKLVVDDIDGLPDTGRFNTDMDQTDEGGTFEIDGATGEWTYTPALNYSGADFIEIEVTDSEGHTSIVQIDFDVTPVDDGEAVIVSGDWADTDEDTAVSGTLVVTDLDGLPDTGKFEKYSDQTDEGGTFDINPDTGYWTYTPPLNFSGTDYIDIVVTDIEGHTSFVWVDWYVEEVDDGEAENE